jgi:hypothetical protein
MRKALSIAVVTGLALAVAGVAFATLRSTGVSATTATFSATKERLTLRTCTGNGDEYVIGKGTYVGTMTFADPNADLGGPIRIWATSVFNKTDNVGYAYGWIRGRDSDKRPNGRFWSTLGSGGSLDGFFEGRVNRRLALLFGDLSATFDAQTGFANGKLGNGTTSLPAVVAGRPCAEPKPAPIAVKLIVRGKVEAVSATSLTVKPNDGSSSQTCGVKAGVSPSTANTQVGDTVEMRCGLVDSQMTLLKLSKKKSG